MTTASARPILWDVYEEHLDEAAFLWGQWHQAMDAANYALEDVIAGPEERLLAHLDGLVLGGRRVAERLLMPALGDEDGGKVTTATWALLHAEDADHLDMVLDALANAANKETRAAMGLAFELSHRTDLAPRLMPMMRNSAPAVQAVIVNVLSARREPAPAGSARTSPFFLEELLATRHPELLVAALRALRRTPDLSCAHLVEAPLNSPYLTIRDTAIETGMILGMRGAWQACNKLVGRKAMGCRLPLALLALGGEPADVRSVVKRLDVPEMRRDALWALGFAGTVEAAEATLTLIDDEDSGALAGESFATITGVPLTGRLVEVGQTDNAAPPAVDEDDDAPLPMVKPEDDLPKPNVDRLRAWWEKAKAGFDPETRYLYGRPATADTLAAVIRGGPTWRRRTWCLEVAMRGWADVEVGSWARQQKQAEEKFLTAPRGDRELPAVRKV